MEEAIETWLVEISEGEGCGAGYFSSTHFDEIFDPPEGGYFSLSFGVSVIAECWPLCLESRGGVPRVAFTLRSSSRIDVRAPSLDSIASEFDLFHPPELYIVKRNVEYLTGGQEEYRSSYLDRRLGETEDGGFIQASYSCYRDELSRLRGWDFSRTLWLDVSSE